MAVKKQSPDPDYRQSDIRAFNQELITTAGMSNLKGSIGFYGGKKISDNYYLFMEPLEGDWSKLAAKKPLTPLSELSMMTDVAEGLEGLHLGGRVHFDLKPQNIGFTGSQSRLIDYGLSKNARTGTRPWGTFIPKSDAGLHSFHKYDPRSTDVFAMGLSFLSLKTKINLWPELLYPSGARAPSPIQIDSKKLWRYLEGDGVLSGNGTYKLGNLNPQEILLLKQMTHPDWTKRPPMSQVVRELRKMQVVRLRKSGQESLYAHAA